MFNTPYNRIRVNSESSVAAFSRTSTLGYVSMERRIREYMLAGKRLQAYRDYISEEEYPEDGSDADVSLPYLDELSALEVLNDSANANKRSHSPEVSEGATKTEERSDVVEGASEASSGSRELVSE